MKLSKLSLILVSTAFVAACGGGGADPAPNNSGGGSSSPTATANKAEGFYTGTFSTAAFPNGVLQTIILENDQVWGAYGTRDATTGANIIYGIFQGTGASNNGSYSSSDIKDFYYTGTTTTGTLSASYQAGVSLNGSASANGQSASFVASVPANSTYVYSAPALLADITGSWTGTTLGGAISSFTIGNTGSFSVSNAGCVTSGTVVPRPSGKNVFDLSVVVATSSACGGNAGLSATGIVVTNLLTNGSRQLVALYVDSSRTAGTAFIATR